MKKVMCSELGDTTCSHVFEAGSFDDLVKQAEEHIMSDPNHGKEREQMASATEEDKQKWMEMAKNVYDSKQDE